MISSLVGRKFRGWVELISSNGALCSSLGCAIDIFFQKFTFARALCEVEIAHNEASLSTFHRLWKGLEAPSKQGHLEGRAPLPASARGL